MIIVGSNSTLFDGVFNQKKAVSIRFLNSIIYEYCRREYVKWLKENFWEEAFPENSSEEHNDDKCTKCLRWNGSHADIIRLLIALSDNNKFKRFDGSKPEQKEVMDHFGEMLHLDFSDYMNNLNNGLDSKIETNIKLFNDLSKSIQRRHTDKN